MSETLRIGTSGFVYKGWRNVFYPPGLKSAEWLTFYAKQFDTVELNTTFYHLVKRSETRKWRRDVTEDFEFAVKGSRYITHMLKLKEARPALERFLAPIRELGPRLGPVLFQLPPHWHCNPDRLEAFLKLFARRRLRLVLEFRERDWYNDTVYDILRRHKASLCLHDMEGSEYVQAEVGHLVYIRMHGSGVRYGGSYPDATLQALAGRIRRWHREGRPVYVYFNNDAEGNAIRNAGTLRTMVGIDR